MRSESITPDHLKVGVLLTDKNTGEKIGIIEFDPSGMLITRVFKNTVHVNSLNPFVQMILKKPLYVKLSDLLNAKKELPADILEKEAVSFAERLDQWEQPITLGKFTIKANAVRF